MTGHQDERVLKAIACAGGSAGTRDGLQKPMQCWGDKVRGRVNGMRCWGVGLVNKCKALQVGGCDRVLDLLQFTIA
ncbi:hypothetical protein [Phormidium sp. CCY1219]|uniref:hypothetical protein n=1 Tax=Phormidium sp. CCY1219 TaxID=2886104 RepID=UPI002D1EB467|nr:hypothetical protein [Phormidium sp. CCY1219]MEB3825897.1 hypothetical protein [Phormidium sp. CCY1219]